MKARWLAVPLVLAAIVCGMLRRDRAPAGKPVAGPEVAAPPEVVVQDGLTVVGGTRFDLHYRSPGTSPAEDMRAVAELLDAAALLVKDIERFPLPENADFTAFLRGGNPHQVAWIRSGHPAVSPRGELLDRWEVPVFFHKESSRRISLRSAGPDRRMWTADDIVWPEP